MVSWRAASPLLLASLLGSSGVLHLVRPRVFEPLIPDVLGSPGTWVVASGVAELACAAALVSPGTRRAGGVASAALLVGVFPGNVKMALDARPGARAWARRPAVAWARLPLQVPLVAWALDVARQP
ncbi:DoxX family protein [Oerskovia flava]|uniref:DoxX family protein n=1 Tax=Oerskovia flava TaxID=2986422 RepID=UPI0022402766|nr:DoxX family protein [Oerskovia sp. JB1-3-2]